MEACPLYIDKTGTDLKTGFGASRGPTQAKPGQDPQGPGTHQGATPAKNQQQRKEGGRGRTPEAQTDRQDKRQHDRQPSRHHDRRTDRQTAEGRRRNKHTHPPGKHTTTPPTHTDKHARRPTHTHNRQAGERHAPTHPRSRQRKKRSASSRWFAKPDPVKTSKTGRAAVVSARRHKRRCTKRANGERASQSALLCMHDPVKSSKTGSAAVVSARPKPRRPHGPRQRRAPPRRLNR